MRVRLATGDRLLLLNTDRPIGSGGEARVYPVVGDDALVAKLYHTPSEEQRHKLLAMLADPPEDPLKEQGHPAISWPLGILTLDTRQRPFVGYVMSRVSGGHAVFSVYNPSSRRQTSPLFHYQYLHRTARNIAAAARALHGHGYVIGDVNESNILVKETALISLVDTDSFQVRDPHSGVLYRCPVGKPEFTPPELQNQAFATVDRRIEHDLFGLAVLFFQLLMEGTHPFAGVYQGQGDPPPYEARILAGHYPHGSRHTPYLPMPAAPEITLLHPTVRQLFSRCFEDGWSHASSRPDAQTWLTVLTEAERNLAVCERNPQHRFGGHLSACPWCERTRALGGRDPFPSEAPLPRQNRTRPASRKTPTVVTASLSPGAFVAAPAAPSGAGSHWSATTATYSGPPAGAGWGAMALPNNGMAVGALAAALVAMVTPALQAPGLGVFLGLLAMLLAWRGWRNASQLQGSGRGIAGFSGSLGGITACALTALSILHAVQSRTVQVLSGNGGAIRSVAFSPDGNLLAGASSRVEADRAPGTVSVWEAQGGRLRYNLQGFSGDVVAVAFSPDSKLLATGSGGPMEYGELRLWDASDGWLKRRMVRCRGYVNAVAFAPDGRRVACGGTDGIVRVMDVQDGALIQTLTTGDEVNAVAFSSDGKLLAAGSGTSGRRLKPGQVLVWAEPSGSLQWKHAAHSSAVSALAFDDRSGALVSGGHDNSVRLWDAATGSVRRTLEGTGFWIGGVAVSPDGALVASGGDVGTATVWSATTATIVHTFPDHEPIYTVAFDRTGARIATGGATGAVRLWRIAPPPR